MLGDCLAVLFNRRPDVILSNGERDDLVLTERDVDQLDGEGRQGLVGVLLHDTVATGGPTTITALLHAHHKLLFHLCHSHRLGEVMATLNNAVGENK